jgi:hypothetical protein
VQIPPGYVKCPRCHTVLPQTQPGAGRRRPTTDLGGGTSVSGGMDRTLIYIGVGAIVLLAVVTFALTRGDDPVRPAPAEGSDEAVVDDDTDTTDTGGDQTTFVPPDRPPTPVAQGSAEPPPEINPGAVIAGLGAALRGERLWASVNADGATVVIQSSFCEDGGLTAIVDGYARELREARFTAVRCRAPHGETVFEKTL